MTRRLVATAAMFAGALALIIGLSGSIAGQMDATPNASVPAHPAHIHAGTCDTLGDVVHPLEHVTIPGIDLLGTPESGMMDEIATPDDGAGETLTLFSTTTVDASLDDILAAEHAINLHASDEDMGTYVACGDLTGTPADGELVVSLEELNGSGVSGEATLTDVGDGTTLVVIEVTHGEDGGTPEASPIS